MHDLTRQKLANFGLGYIRQYLSQLSQQSMITKDDNLGTFNFKPFSFAFHLKGKNMGGFKTKHVAVWAFLHYYTYWIKQGDSFLIEKMQGIDH